MYGLKWPFLLMYGSHNMRHTGIPRVDRLLTRHPGIGASQHLSTIPACSVSGTHILIV